VYEQHAPNSSESQQQHQKIQASKGGLAGAITKAKKENLKVMKQ
jgi:hypothetical protein